MGYAFISYSTKNQESADTMRELLIGQGIETWMAPNDIPAGSNYAKMINRALKECSCFVLILSNEAQESIWVAKEVERAINYRKPIIPVQIEDVILNDEFELYISTDQIVTVKKIDADSKDMKKVLNSINSYLGNIKKDRASENKHPDEKSSKAKSKRSKDNNLPGTVDDLNRFEQKNSVDSDGMGNDSYISKIVDIIASDLAEDKIDKLKSFKSPNDSRQLLGISLGWDCISVAYPSDQGIVSVNLGKDSFIEPAIFSLTEAGKLLFVNDEKGFRSRNPQAPICYLGELILDENKKIIYGKKRLSGYHIIKKYCEYLRLKISQIFGEYTGVCVVTLPTKDLNAWIKWKGHLTNAGFHVKKIIHQSAAVSFYNYWKDNIPNKKGRLLYCTLDRKYLELCIPEMKNGLVQYYIVSDYLSGNEDLSMLFKRLSEQLAYLAGIKFSEVKRYIFVFNGTSSDGYASRLSAIVKEQCTESYSSYYFKLCEQAARGCAVQVGKLHGLSSFGNVTLLDSLPYDIGIKYQGKARNHPQFLTIFKNNTKVPTEADKTIVLKDYLSSKRQMEFFYSVDLNSNSYPAQCFRYKYFDDKKYIDTQKAMAIRFVAENNMDFFTKVLFY